MVSKGLFKAIECRQCSGKGEGGQADMGNWGQTLGVGCLVIEATAAPRPLAQPPLDFAAHGGEDQELELLDSN